MTISTRKKLDFNSHAHVERDVYIVRENAQLFISTHTLTWSVTCKHAIGFGPQHDISTHTLTWSVTLLNFPTQR